MVFAGKSKNFFVPLRELIPVSFMKGAQVFPVWGDMQTFLAGEKGNFNKELAFCRQAEMSFGR